MGQILGTTSRRGAQPSSMGSPWGSLPPALGAQTPRITFPLAVYAHRGGPLERPGFIENSMPAFRNAAKLKVDLLELDVQMTRDGQVVVFHDRDMGRMFGPRFAGKCIADFMYESLPPLLSNSTNIATNGATTTSSGKQNGTHSSSSSRNGEENGMHALNGVGSEGRSKGADATADVAVSRAAAAGGDADEARRVPLLQDVFAEFPTFPIQVDLKATTPGLVEAVLKLVAHHPGRRERVLLGSFIDTVNKQIYETDPGIPLFMSAKRMLYLWACFKLGLLSWTRIHESAAILPWKAPAFPFSLFPHFLLDAAFFRALNARGVAVIVYGDRASFNSEAPYRRVRDAGANAICTDAPSLLQGLLQREGPLAPLPWAKRE